MSTSITKYQITPGSKLLPLPLTPDLPIFTPQISPKNVSKSQNLNSAVSANSEPLVHAQLLDSPIDPSRPSFLPGILEQFRENPLTNPIPMENNALSASDWKTRVGIGIICFFLGASLAIILMLYLY